LSLTPANDPLNQDVASKIAMLQAPTTAASDGVEEIVYGPITEQRLHSMGSGNGNSAALQNYFAQGTVSVGQAKMDIVGGIVLDGAPVMWVKAHDLSLQRATVHVPQGALPKLPSTNQSVGVLRSVSTKTGVEFSEALFMSPAPAEGTNVRPSSPPFFFYLSPLSGASWQRPKDAQPDNSALPQLKQMIVTAMIPDIFEYRYLDGMGKTAWTRRPYFVATKPDSLSRDNLVRIEEMELPDRTEIAKGVFLRKVAIALQGLQGADEFPSKLGDPLTLAYAPDLGDAQQWYVEDGEGKKSRLLKQEVDSSGTTILMYENGISLPAVTLLKSLKGY